MLLLLVFFLAMSGYVVSSDDYISGGSKTEPHQFPWMVRIVGGCAGK